VQARIPNSQKQRKEEQIWGIKRYFRPFSIIQEIGQVAYRLEHHHQSRDT